VSTFKFVIQVVWWRCGRTEICSLVCKSLLLHNKYSRGLWWLLFVVNRLKHSLISSIKTICVAIISLLIKISWLYLYPLTSWESCIQHCTKFCRLRIFGGNICDTMSEHRTHVWTQDTCLNTGHMSEHRTHVWTQNTCLNTEHMSEHRTHVWTQDTCLSTGHMSEHRTQTCTVNRKHNPSPQCTLNVAVLARSVEVWWGGDAIKFGHFLWHSRNDQQYALVVPVLYAINWLLHVSAVACHHQGAS
jgi:hypothetical protein